MLDNIHFPLFSTLPTVLLKWNNTNKHSKYDNIQNYTIH